MIHYTLSWDTRTGYQIRHYCRHYSDKDVAIAKAQLVERRPNTEFVRIREMESWDDENNVRHIRFIGRVDF